MPASQKRQGQNFTSRSPGRAVERIASLGADIVGDSPAEFAAFIAAESAKYARIIKQAGVLD